MMLSCYYGFFVLVPLCCLFATTTTAFVPSLHNHHYYHHYHPTSLLLKSSANANHPTENEEQQQQQQQDVVVQVSTKIPPPEITTKALIQLYPSLVEHKSKFGNPNIPLGTTQGRQCAQIRRMQIQNKLTAEEVTLLKEMGFLFHSLEDTYQQLDFEEMLPRLKAAKEANNGNLDIPKKYAPDPELGAYVTGIRRLGKDQIDSAHVRRLDDIGFVWVSSRKCGSKFMEQYRVIQKQLDDVKADNDKEVVLSNPDVIKFVRAQREAYKRQTLSETRIEYMTRLLGEEWWVFRDDEA